MIDHRTPGAMPRFTVQLEKPDLSPWCAGNAGVPGFLTFDSGHAGPHVAVVAAIHGNELAGAIVLDRLLRAGVRPQSGQLTLGFANMQALAHFDPTAPTLSRFVDEDLNRVWGAPLWSTKGTSAEHKRARQIHPLLGKVDLLLDLHSMLWPSDPLILCGGTRKGRDLALRLGVPGLVVADQGHATGRRLIDDESFTAPGHPRTAILVEAGQHWMPETVTTSLASVAAFLRVAGVVHRHPALPPPAHVQMPSRFAEVTHTVVAHTPQFTFVRGFRGGEVIAHRHTLLAMDGAQEIRTPYDDCLLVMPSLRPGQGHTAVRLARFEDRIAPP